MIWRIAVLISLETGINHEYHGVKFQSVRRETEYGNRLSSLAIAWLVFDLETTTINTAQQSECRETIIDILNNPHPTGRWHRKFRCTAHKLACRVTVESVCLSVSLSLSLSLSLVTNFEIRTSTVIHQPFKLLSVLWIFLTMASNLGNTIFSVCILKLRYVLDTLFLQHHSKSDS
jgi:hypothetical protein